MAIGESHGTRILIRYVSLFALATLVATSTASAQSRNFRQIAAGVWFRTGAPLVLPGGVDIAENSMIVEMKDYLVLIDSGTTNSAVGMLGDCRLISTKPVKYVFLTHHHFDHVGANAFWTEHGATTMAFRPVADELRKTQFQVPQKILEGNTFVLDDGSRRLEFHTYGWAHTRGDGIALLPKERVLFSGDIVLNAPYNSLFDSDLRNWPVVIRKLEELDPLLVLPGHGEPGGKDLLRGQREFLESLIRQVQQAIKEGKKIDEIVEIRNGQPASSRFVFPASIWSQGPFLGDQVKSAYEQLSK